MQIKALLSMLARLPWERRDMLGSMNGKHGGVFVTLLFIIPRTVLLSSIQLEAETLDFSAHALPRNL